ncbi:MAG: oligosaccharide flippase family protein, partial [Acidobacteriia bacterium]|nr:oligosaccharide flippase family protein [Terriglobia bacterium]
YGVNFQVVSIVTMLFEPTTKALMAKFGGLTSTAYYEMASRMVSQVRALLVSANQAMVPQVAELHENEPEQISKVYSDSYRIVFFLALLLFVGVALVVPLMSELWIGHYEKTFVTYSILLIAGLWLNTLSGPAYFVNLGTGLLRWNTLAHVTIGILNVILGYSLGVVLGGEGVALGYVLALVIGSSLVILGYQRDHQIPLAELLPSESRRLFFSCCTGLLSTWAVFRFLEVPQNVLGKTGLSLVICTIVIGPAFWMHSLRARITSLSLAAFYK